MKLIIKGLLIAVLFLGISVKAEVVEAPAAPHELSVKEKVEFIFHDSPIMIKKLHCESGYRQFDEKGNPLKSKTLDYGVAQINHSHLKEAESLGLDIKNSVDDNLKYARLLFDKYGSSQWYAPSTPDCT